MDAAVKFMCQLAALLFVGALSLVIAGSIVAVVVGFILSAFGSESEKEKEL